MGCFLFCACEGPWVHGKEDWGHRKEHEEEQWQAVEDRAWAVSKGMQSICFGNTFALVSMLPCAIQSIFIMIFMFVDSFFQSAVFVGLFFALKFLTLTACICIRNALEGYIVYKSEANDAWICKRFTQCCTLNLLNTIWCETKTNNIEEKS